MESLQLLYLNDNKIIGSIPSGIGMMESLQLFYLNDNELTGSIPSEIGTMPNLNTLFLNGNSLEWSYETRIPEGLYQSSSLYHVRLDDRFGDNASPSCSGGTCT